MKTCPLCGSPAEITDVVIESYEVECPECKRYRITKIAFEFIQQNPNKVKDQLPLLSRAVPDAQIPLLITDGEDIADTAAKQLAK